jgi:RNA polymerase sigma-70 factor (ECF subfamily)
MNLESIWQEYSTSLRAFLHSRVSNDADVEDLLQEVLIKTHQNLDTVASSEKIKPWLFQVTNNTIIDFYRKKGRTKDVSAADLWYAEDDDVGVEQALAKCVEPFIRALPTKSADLLLAIDIEGQSQKDYAKKAGISYSTLKSQVQRGRARLRTLFDDCCSLTLDKHGNVVEFQAKSGGCESC